MKFELSTFKCTSCSSCIKDIGQICIAHLLPFICRSCHENQGSKNFPNLVERAMILLLCAAGYGMWFTLTLMRKKCTICKMHVHLKSISACLLRCLPRLCWILDATSLRWPPKTCWLFCDGRWLVLTLTFVLWTRRVEDGYLPLKPAPFVNTATTYANLVRYIMHECSYSVNGSSACSSLIICLTFVHALVLKEGYIALTAWSAANSLKLFKRRPKLHIQEEIGFLVCELWSSHFFCRCACLMMLIVACMHALGL